MRSALLAALLVAATWTAFAQTLGHDFLEYDDDVYVTENPLLREGPTPAAIGRAFRAPYEANWIPLTWISLQVDSALYGRDPAGFHATNLALHTLAALLLFAALRRMTGEALPSGLVAAVFAVHPLHVESVAWIAERKDVLSGAAFAATLWAYARYVEAPSTPRYLLVAATTLVGLLAKPMLVTLPFVLWLLDFWPLRRLRWRGALPRPTARVVWEKLPLLALSGIAAFAAWSAQQGAGAMAHGGAFPFPVRLANAALSLVAYLRDALWPAQLAVFHPHPGADVSFAGAALAALGLLALTAAALRLAPSRPHLLVGWLWFVGMLLPVLGLVQVGLQARADRYTYLPLVGLAIACAWSLRDAASTPARRRAAVAFGAVAVIAMTATARAQVAHWRDTESLFRHAARVTRDNFLAHQWLGSLLLRRGEIDDAERHFREALRIAPEWSQAQRGIADVHAERGDWPAAVLAYERALRLTPRDARGHLRLARALAADGQHAEALGRARFALRLARGPVRAEAQLMLGTILAQRGDPAAAVAAFDRALAVSPDLAEAHAARGLALLGQGRVEEGEAALRRAHRHGMDAAPLSAAATQLARELEAAGDAALAARVAGCAERLESAEGAPADRS